MPEKYKLNHPKTKINEQLDTVMELFLTLGLIIFI